MRRKDREIVERSEILKVLDQCDTMRLGLADREGVYIVPVSFGYIHQKEMLTFYFHSASEGRKVSALAQDSGVTFEMDTAHVFREKETGCACTMEYACVMGKGRAELLADTEEKANALRQILEHYTDQKPLLDEMMVVKTNVYKLEVKWEAVSCKVHR